jgi:hypothetical protein
VNDRFGRLSALRADELRQALYSEVEDSIPHSMRS